jgi:serine phosphatase RsbU (regulator of sigma subunit)
VSNRASKVSKRLAQSRGKSESGTAKIPGKKTARTKRVKAKSKKGKTGKIGRVRRRPKEEQPELEPITPFERGWYRSVGVKFAGLTAGMVALFMGLLGYLTHSISAENLNDQINEQGVSIVRTLEKAIDRRLWIAQQEREPRRGEPRLPRRDEEQIKKKLFSDWEKRLEEAVKQSEGKIVAISIINKKQGDERHQAQVVQFPKGELAIAGQHSIGEKGDVKIFEGKVGGERVRRFDKPVTLDLLQKDTEITKLLETARLNDRESKEHTEALLGLQKTVGLGLQTLAEWEDWRQHENPPLYPRDEVLGFDPWVSVFIKASRLDDVKAKMGTRISVVTLLGAVAGVLLAVLISAVLTGPVRELEADIREVAEGNLDHQSRVHSKDEIGGLAHVFNVMTRNLKTAQANAVERQAFERELNIAKEIQEKLLPERIPQIPGFDIESHYKAAKEVGGDYYDFIVIDQNHLGIIVADVAGKGIPGAMVMTMARSLVRLASVRNVSPADTFKKVNRILAKDIRRGMFVTAAYMVLNVKTKTLRVASAGHNPVVLFRASTGENTLVKPKGIALGFDKGTIFDNNIQEAEVQLEPGDRIVTYTDGVNEAMNNDSEEFGDERFYELTRTHARKSSKEFVEAVVAALDDHRGDAEQSDDITITTLSVKGKAKA